MSSLLDRAFSAEQFRSDGHRLVDSLADYLQSISTDPNQPVLAWQDPDQCHAYWDDPTGLDDPCDLFKEVTAQAIHLHHPGYMGHQISPALPIAALSGMVVDLLNNGMGVYEMGMPGTAIERVVVDTTARVMGFDATAGGFLTSGGTLGNLTALLAARSYATESHSDMLDHGAVMVSDQAHFCIERAIRIMGWGSEGVIKVPTNDRFQIRTDLLPELYRRAESDGRRVIAVVGSACSTSTGSFDDLSKIGHFCQAHDLWFHVDGAHGAALAFSRKHRHRLDGLASADSVVMDYHKMLLVPSIASALIFRDARRGYQTFRQDAAYLWSGREHEMEWFNLVRRTFECTKSMLGLKIYSIMHAYGLGVFDENVTRVVDLASTFAELIAGRRQLQLAVEPQANIVCFRHVGDGGDEQTLNQRNAQIRDSLLKEGAFYVVQTRLDGKVWLRTTLANAMTTRRDLETLLDKIESMVRR